MRVRLRGSKGRLGIAITVVGSAVAGLLAAAAGTHAKYPGANGQIAFARFDRAIDGYHVFTANARGSHETQLLPGDAESPIWSPDGSRILVTVISADAPARPATLNPDRSGFTLLGNPAGTETGCSAWSPDGARLLCHVTSDARPGLNGLYTVRASDGGDRVRLTDNPFDEADIAGDYSPDGARIAFTRQRPSRKGLEGALFVANADGTEPRQITPFGLPDHDELPKWSPDGNEILFGSATEKLLLVQPDGTGLEEISPRVLGRSATRKLRMRLLKRCRNKGESERCSRKAMKRARKRATGIGFDPGWSPDGKRIVFSLRRRARGRVDIYTARPDGTHPIQVTDTRDFETFSDWGARSMSPTTSQAAGPSQPPPP
jgi:Tol biopolymer transport system component